MISQQGEHIGRGSVCCACGETEKPLVLHHWWAVDAPVAGKSTAWVCRRCNGLPCISGTYLLPCWAEQLKLIQREYLDDMILRSEDVEEDDDADIAFARYGLLDNDAKPQDLDEFKACWFDIKKDAKGGYYLDCLSVGEYNESNCL